MPKIRERRAQKTSLSVSPWVPKKGLSEGKPSSQPAQGTQQLMYSVVLSAEPLSSNMQHPAVSQEILAGQHASAASLRSTQQPAHAAAQDMSSGWHAVCRSTRGTRSTHSPEQQQKQQQQPGTDDLPMPLMRQPHASQQKQQESEKNAQSGDSSTANTTSSTRPQGSTVLRGVAQLVLLPSGAILGHFIATGVDAAAAAADDDDDDDESTESHEAQQRAQPQPQPQLSTPQVHQQPEQQLQQQPQRQQKARLCLGLEGRQVLGIHSCYRDSEWALLQLTLTRRGGGGSSDGAGAGSSSSSSGQEDDSDTAATAATAAAAAAEGMQVAGCLQQHKQRAFGYGHHAQKRARLQQKQEQPDQAACKHLELQPPARASPPELQPPAAEAAVAWVQRSGGDLVTLQPADLDDEDTEQAILQDNLGLQAADFPHVLFAGHTLLAGERAAGLLGRAGWGRLAGQPGVVVNLGDMVISKLPDRFIHDSSQ